VLCPQATCTSRARVPPRSQRQQQHEGVSLCRALTQGAKGSSSSARRSSCCDLKGRGIRPTAVACAAAAAACDDTASR
jgi:hypothetical protein